MMAASALAANAVLRSLVGFAFPVRHLLVLLMLSTALADSRSLREQLFTQQLFSAMGNQWALTFFAFLSLILTPVPFAFYFYGARIRARSKFAYQHKPAAPTVPQSAPSEIPTSATVTRTPTREELEREEIDLLDLRQVESRREQLEALRKDGIEFSERSS